MTSLSSNSSPLAFIVLLHVLGIKEVCKFDLRKVDLFAQINLLLAFGPRLAQNNIIDWIIAMVSRVAEHLVVIV